MSQRERRRPRCHNDAEVQLARERADPGPDAVLAQDRTPERHPSGHVEEVKVVREEPGAKGVNADRRDEERQQPESDRSAAEAPDPGPRELRPMLLCWSSHATVLPDLCALLLRPHH